MNLDDLNIDTVGIDTDLARLPDGEYVMALSAFDVQPNSRQDGHNLLVNLINVEETTDHKGRPVLPGAITLTQWLPLQASPSAKNPTAHLARIAQLQDIVLGTDDQSRPAFNQECRDNMLNAEVRVVVKLEDGPQGPRNSVAFINKL